MIDISVILPTFNEKDNILPLIDAIRHQVQGACYEILVVDDSSPDGTAAVVKQCAIPAVRVIVRCDEPGYARSIRRGIEEAKGRVLILMDSDFNHDPAYISSMLRVLCEQDIVSASRFLPGGQMTPLWRSICSQAFNGFIGGVTGSRMTDNLYGFFVIRKDILAGCPFDEIFFGFGDYGLRLLFYLQKQQARILEFPAVYGRRRAGRGNTHLWRMLCQYMGATLALAGKGRIG